MSQAAQHNQHSISSTAQPTQHNQRTSHNIQTEQEHRTNRNGTTHNEIKQNKKKNTCFYAWNCIKLLPVHAQKVHTTQTNYTEFTSTLYSSTGNNFVAFTYRVCRACHAALILEEVTKWRQNSEKLNFHKLAIGLSELAKSDPVV